MWPVITPEQYRQHVTRSTRNHGSTLSPVDRATIASPHLWFPLAAETRPPIVGRVAPAASPRRFAMSDLPWYGWILLCGFAAILIGVLLACFLVGAAFERDDRGYRIRRDEDDLL